MPNPSPSPIHQSRRWPEPIRGVAFDMDGLMFDTEPLYFQTGTQLLARRGKQFTEELQREMMGRPGPEALRVMIQHHTLTDRWQELLIESDEIFMEMIVGKLVKMPGLDEMIERLTAQGIPFGVATSSRRHVAEHLLDETGIAPALDFLLTGDDVTHGKPHPEMYLKAADRLQIDPAEMLVFEDSSNGVRAAAASGACTIAVPGDHSRGHDFSAAWCVADTLHDSCIEALLTRREE